MILRTSILCITLLLCACTQTQVESNITDKPTSSKKIDVISLTDKNKIISSTADPQKIAEITSLLASKKPMLEKMLPIFKMHIVIENNGEKEVWLFAKPKYLKLKSSKNSQIYFVENHKQLTRLLLN